jgi:hypothetical protein
VYYRIAKLADKYGLSQEVDDIDLRMVRVSQVAPVGLTAQQYIQDIYRRIANLASQIQQIQQMQTSNSNSKNNSLQGAVVNFDAMQNPSLTVQSNNPLGVGFEQ